VTWGQVQALLASNAARQRNQAAAQSPSLLAGLIFDQNGEPLTPTHANKKGRRYRYYVSRSALDGSRSATGEGAKRAGASWRLPAAEIEELLVSSACDMLCDGAELFRQLQIGQLDTPQLNRTLANATERGDELRVAPNLEKRAVLRRILRRVEVGQEAVTIQLHASELIQLIDGKELKPARPTAGEAIVLTIPVRLKRRGAIAVMGCSRSARRLPCPGLISGSCEPTEMLSLAGHDPFEGKRREVR
jgi:hypothetical protein